MMYLKCDAEGCDHTENHPDGLTKDLVGKPCPKCGENLLTERDFIDGLKVQLALKIMKSMGLAAPLTDDDEAPEGYAKISISPHNGKLIIGGLLDDA